MAFTQTDIDKMKAAIATGAKTLQIGTERVEYWSLAEMREALAVMEAEVSGSTSRIPVSQPDTSRGL